MKRANGTGCVVKLNGNRRNSWFARAPMTYNKETGKANPPKILSDEKGRKYFPDRTIPDLLLAKYNAQNGNINIDKSEYTFKQMYEEYKEKYFPTKEEMDLEKREHIKAKGKLGCSSSLILITAYNKCEKLYNKLYKSLKKDDFLEIILNTDGGKSTISGLIDLFKKLDIYAEENDIIVKGYARNLKLSSDLYTNKKKKNNPYTYKEIQKIWNHKGKLVADIILITLYTGMRIEEVFFLKNKNVFLDKKYMIGGIKTEAGKNRIIPIHHEIMPIVKSYYNINKEFLFTNKNGDKLKYNKDFYSPFKKLSDELSLNYHISHDGRKTLHSELDRLGANKICIDRIFGHSSGNTGDDVYTKKSIEELISTIEMVDYKNKKDSKITYLNVS